MTCHDFESRINAYLDAETDAAQSRAIRAHLDACPECAAKHDVLRALRTRIRSEVPRYAAPADLRERILASVERAQPRQGTRRSWLGGWRAGSALTVGRWRWLTTGALAGCAATMLAWYVGTAVLDWRVNEDLAVEAVTSHVRATLGNQLIQVASSNQHNVKPWLSARLDYSPPVPDLQQEGFTLVGGRVDYLDHHAVATLVYKIREHTVDVFVRPETNRTQARPIRTVRGFHIATATGSSMEWVAVSDVSPDELAAFVQQLARKAGARSTE